MQREALHIANHLGLLEIPRAHRKTNKQTKKQGIFPSRQKALTKTDYIMGGLGEVGRNCVCFCHRNLNKKLITERYLRDKPSNIWKLNNTLINNLTIKYRVRRILNGMESRIQQYPCGCSHHEA